MEGTVDSSEKEGVEKGREESRPFPWGGPRKYWGDERDSTLNSVM